MTAIFEFSSGILVIVVGLAITHLLAGLGSIIRYRRHLEVDWLPMVWMVVLLLVLVGWCYAIWDILHEVETLEFTHFLVFFLASILFYLAARLITPDINDASRLNLRDVFLETKTAFFLTSAAAFTVIHVYIWVLEGFAFYTSTLEGILGFALLILLPIGAVLKKPKPHWVLVTLWTALYLGQQFMQGALAQSI